MSCANINGDFKIYLGELENSVKEYAKRDRLKRYAAFLQNYCIKFMKSGMSFPQIVCISEIISRRPTEPCKNNGQGCIIILQFAAIYKIAVGCFPEFYTFGTVLGLFTKDKCITT